MKKYHIILVIVVLLILINPTNIFAEDLNINSWIVEADLKDDGSLSIIKDITYFFDTDFNGVYVDIALDNIMSIDNIEVSQILNGEEIGYIQDQKAKKGSNGLFSVNSEKGNTNIMIFSPSEYESKTFRLKYTLYDVASVHSDIGELYYKFIGENNETPIEYFSANIKLHKFNQNDIKIFAHGPLNGNINFVNQSIKLEVTNVPSNTFVEARVLFPLDYIPFASRLGNGSLDNILDEESALIEEIRENEIKRQDRMTLSNNFSIGLSAAGLAILGLLLRRFRRHPDIFDEMKSIYPDDISPAELSLFLNSSIGPRSYIATLLDLSRRKYISFESQESNTKPNRWSKSKDSTSYIFLKNNTATNDLLEHENYLLSWFFNEIGDGQRVSTDDIENYRENNLRKFHKSQSDWQELVKKELSFKAFYDNNSKKYSIRGMIVSILLSIISVVSMIFEGLFGILLLVISIILFIYSIYLFNRKSDKGYIQYRLWKDFKENNTKIEIESLGLSTDLSLIYLIALGLPMKSLDDFRQSYGGEYYPMYWGYYYFLLNNKGGSSFEDKFNNSFYGMTGSSTANSSSFGGGGGFTGGGGGGVGGSGSGGF